MPSRSKLVESNFTHNSAKALNSAGGPVALNYPPITPFALRRAQAAAYCSISPSYFDQLVATGVLPPARLLGTVKGWLRRELEEALEGLPSEIADSPDNGANPCDRLLRPK